MPAFPALVQCKEVSDAAQEVALCARHTLALGLFVESLAHGFEFDAATGEDVRDVFGDFRAAAHDALKTFLVEAIAFSVRQCGNGCHALLPRPQPHPP